MIRIESKLTGEIVETSLCIWRIALNRIKYYAEYRNMKITTKASYMINHIKNGYEDRFIKAWIV